MALLTWNESVLVFGLSIPVMAMLAWAYLVRSEMREAEEKKKMH
jgi:hypothetical protein